jgi:hypothetical protein
MFSRTTGSAKCWIALVAITFIVTPVAAQKTFGPISGTVTDQTNAGVPGAKGAF